MTFDNNKELLIPNIDEMVVQEYENLFPVDAIPADLSDKESYAMVQDGIRVGTQLKTTVEKWRKDEKAEALAHGRKVDAHAKTFSERVVAVLAPMKQAKKDHDTAITIAKAEKEEKEQARVQGIADRIANIKAIPGANIGSTADQVHEAIGSLINTQMEWAEEHEEAASKAADAAIEALSELYAMKVQSEENDRIAAENEQKRKDAEAQLAEDNRIAAQKLADDRAALENEMAKIQAEKDSLAAEVAREKAAIQAEKDKLEGERKEAERQAEVKKQAAEFAVEEAKRKAAENEARIKAEELEAKEEKKRLVKLEAERSEREAVAAKAIHRLLKKLAPKPLSAQASDILGAIVAGDIPAVTFT